MTTTKDRNISLAGTVIFHALLLFLLINLRHCAGGGGGGNGGLNGGPYQSIELAGLGNSIDGWGESLEEAAEAPTTTTETVTDDVAITENTNTAAPTVKTDKPTTKNPDPKANSKPAEKTEAQKQQEKLNNLMNQASKLGKGNTTGSGKQGTENGQVDKNGIFGPGGQPGNGNGPPGEGNGPGGKGIGQNFQHTLTGRTYASKPKLTGNADGLDCKMIISVTVSPQGDVTQAEATGGTCVDFARARDLAIKAVKQAKFSQSNSNFPQTGTVTIVFESN
jgi:hypothetical protein